MERETPFDPSEISFSQKSPEKPLDWRWTERMEKYGSFQAYEYLDGDPQIRLAEKNKFLAGEIENPHLDYPKLNAGDLKIKEDQLLALKKEIRAEEQSEVVGKAYGWKINEKIAELRMMQAALVGDAKKFTRWSGFVYGKPSPEIFSYTVAGLKEKLTKALASDNENIRKSAESLMAAIPKDLPGVEISTPPTQEPVGQTKKQTEKELSDLLDLPNVEGELSSEDLKQVFESALNKLEAEGWSVAVAPEKNSISVNQEQKSVNIPPARKYLEASVRFLIAHEIGTHVARRLQGERSKLRLLGVGGLDRYERAEEGVATLREQALENEFKDFAGLMGHLSIGLAAGVDGRPRDFRQVFDVLEKYYVFSKTLNKPEDDPAVIAKAARDAAYGSCVRVFRGTDCRTPGACFTKDIIYREGNVAVWDVIKADQDAMMKFNLGKYDPANSRHLWILERLGISDADLK